MDRSKYLRNMKVSQKKDGRYRNNKTSITHTVVDVAKANIVALNEESRNKSWILIITMQQKLRGHSLKATGI